jgi:hypothetical protein
MPSTVLLWARFEITTSGLVAPMSERITPLKRGYRSEVPLTMLGFLLCLCPSSTTASSGPSFSSKSWGCYLGPAPSKPTQLSFLPRWIETGLRQNGGQRNRLTIRTYHEHIPTPPNTRDALWPKVPRPFHSRTRNNSMRLRIRPSRRAAAMRARR